MPVAASDPRETVQSIRTGRQMAQQRERRWPMSHGSAGRSVTRSMEHYRWAFRTSD